MTNPITAAKNWLLAHPVASHAVVSGLETYVLGTVLAIAAPFAAKAVSADPAAMTHAAPGVAAGLISAVYYGRESGQLEHDLKHGTTSHGVVSGFWAFVGAEFMLYWSKDNWAQWLSAAAATSAVAAAMIAGQFAGPAVGSVLVDLAHGALGG